jgi:hypothetical protein
MKQDVSLGFSIGRTQLFLKNSYLQHMKYITDRYYLLLLFIFVLKQN